MIPWASPSLLASNPAFEQLHKRLVTDILDHDCTTRRRRRSSPPPPHNQQQQQQLQDQSSVVVTERLTAHRVSLAREQLLAAVLFDLALGDDQDEVPLSKDVREASLTIATYLYRHYHRRGAAKQQQQQQQQRLLLPLLLSDISTLHSNTPVLSNRVLAQYTVLKDIALASASSTTTSTSTSTPKLSDLVSRQLKQLQELQTQTVPRAQYGVTNSAVELLRAQAEEMEWLVRWLEQRRHGAEGRYVVGRARWLAGVARGMVAKARVGYLEVWRDGILVDDGGNGDEEGGWQQKVRRKMGQLEEEEEELERRKSQLSEALAEYDDEGLMEQLGKRYAEIESEIDQVKADVERLSSRSPQWVPP